MQEMHCFQGHRNLPVDPLEDLTRHLPHPRFGKRGPHIDLLQWKCAKECPFEDYGVLCKNPHPPTNNT